MSRGQRVAEAIERSVSGPMWHGPALADLVADVTAQQASQRVIPDGHTIWELVLHVTAWTEIARERLIGSANADPTPEEDWPPVRDTSAEAWRTTIERLKEAHRELGADVAKLGDSDLIGRVPGKDHTVLTMVHGIIEHDAYHGGQISILKKGLGIST
jgi:uncharacterized damage-inducible protein DinB